MNNPTNNPSAGQARGQATTKLDTRKDKAADTIGSVANVIRESSDKLKDVGPLGDVASRAADRIEKVAAFFKDRQVAEILEDVQQFARREPALIIGGAFVLGIFGGRFLKSSAKGEMQYSEYRRSGRAVYEPESEEEATASRYEDDLGYIGEEDVEGGNLLFDDEPEEL